MIIMKFSCLRKGRNGVLMIKRLYHQVKNENGKRINVLDFDKIRQEPHDFFIILSERFRQGKTVSVMNHILERYIKHGESAILILNTAELFKMNYHKLIAMNRYIYTEM
jgi:hypothetical protein